MVRYKKKPYSHLYSTKRWQALRRQTFKRDGYVCQHTGIICVGKYPAPNSPVCDHVVRHEGDTALFHDPDNLQTLSKLAHDSYKQGLEKNTQRIQRNDGW